MIDRLKLYGLYALRWLFPKLTICVKPGRNDTSHIRGAFEIDGVWFCPTCERAVERPWNQPKPMEAAEPISAGELVELDSDGKIRSAETEWSAPEFNEEGGFFERVQIRRPITRILGPVIEKETDVDDQRNT